MADQPVSDKPDSHPRELPLRWSVALVCGMCILIPLLSATAKEVGERFGAEGAAMWIAWAVTFVIICAVCAFITRRYTNPYVHIICGVFVGMAAGERVEEALRSPDRGSWPKFAGFLVFFGVYVVWMYVVPRLLAKRPKP
jgi:hypothetical protein